MGVMLFWTLLMYVNRACILEPLGQRDIRDHLDPYSHEIWSWLKVDGTKVEHLGSNNGTDCGIHWCVCVCVGGDLHYHCAASFHLLYRKCRNTLSSNPPVNHMLDDTVWLNIDWIFGLQPSASGSMFNSGGLALVALTKGGVGVVGAGNICSDKR